MSVCHVLDVLCLCDYRNSFSGVPQGSTIVPSFNVSYEYTHAGAMLCYVLAKNMLMAFAYLYYFI